MTTLGATASTTTFPAGGSSAFEMDTTATVGGSGATNLTAINADLATLTAAGGGTLKFARGIYDIGVSGSSSILIAIPANCRLLGAGIDITVIKSASTQNGHKPLGMTSIANSSVEAMTIDAASGTTSSAGISTSGATYCTVTNCRFSADFGWGIFIGVDSREVAVVDCVFDGTTGSHNVEINGSSYNSVSGCVFKGAGAGQQGIEVYDASATRCTGNRITSNTFLAANYSAILTAGDINTVIANNVINAANVYGISMVVSAYDGARFPTGCTIVGNTINGCNVGGGATGIALTQGVDCVIANNTITNTAGSGDGIFINGGTGGTISGNVCSTNGGNGLNLNDSVTRTMVIGNQFNNNSGTAVDSKSGMVCTGTDNTIIANSGNDTRGASNRQYHGISITGASNTVIGNRGTGNRNVNINVTGATSPQFANDQTNTPTALHGYIGFYGTTPIAKPTGVAVTEAGIHAALVSLGLIAA